MINVSYLVVMSAIVILIAALSVPSLFWPKCAVCKHRVWAAHSVCTHCGAPLRDDLDF